MGSLEFILQMVTALAMPAALIAIAWALHRYHTKPWTTKADVQRMALFNAKCRALLAEAEAEDSDLSSRELDADEEDTILRARLIARHEAIAHDAYLKTEKLFKDKLDEKL